MKKISIKIFLMFLALASVSAKAQKLFLEKGVALRGYDAVAFHIEKKAVLGHDSLQVNWGQGIWKFSTSLNLDRFRKDPEKYAPAYGGYCAYGVSDGHLSPTDPNAFTIVNDTLYLNYSLKVKELWLKDTAQHIKNANKNWPKLQ